jgi:hypothetical protein
MSVNGRMQEVPSLQLEHYNKDVIKLYSNGNLRSAILDITCMSVYFFNGNRRIIATEQMNKTVVAAMDLCKIWVHDGTYNESDFAA